MKWHELADQHCSVARSLAVIGDRWTLLIIRDLFLGAARFETLREGLQISRTILTDRLNLLEKEGVIRKIAYQDRPTRYKYLLTEKGLDLYPIIVTMTHWGDQYYAGEAGPPIIHHHRNCDQDFVPVVSCSACQEPLKPLETSVRVRGSSDSVLDALKKSQA